MAEKKKPLIESPPDLGSLPLSTAHLMLSGLIKSEGLTQEDVGNCIGRTRQTMSKILGTSDYPLELLRVLDCLGYDAEIVIRTKIKTPKGEG
jgi:hypothetical protein